MNLTKKASKVTKIGVNAVSNVAEAGVKTVTKVGEAGVKTVTKAGEIGVKGVTGTAKRISSLIIDEKDDTDELRKQIDKDEFDDYFCNLKALPEPPKQGQRPGLHNSWSCADFEAAAQQEYSSDEDEDPKKPISLSMIFQSGTTKGRKGKKLMKTDDDLGRSFGCTSREQMMKESGAVSSCRSLGSLEGAIMMKRKPACSSAQSDASAPKKKNRKKKGTKKGLLNDSAHSTTSSATSLSSMNDSTHSKKATSTRKKKKKEKGLLNDSTHSTCSATSLSSMNDSTHSKKATKARKKKKDKGTGNGSDDLTVKSKKKCKKKKGSATSARNDTTQIASPGENKGSEEKKTISEESETKKTEILQYWLDASARTSTTAEASSSSSTTTTTNLSGTQTNTTADTPEGSSREPHHQPPKESSNDSASGSNQKAATTGKEGEATKTESTASAIGQLVAASTATSGSTSKWGKLKTVSLLVGKAQVNSKFTNLWTSEAENSVRGGVAATSSPTTKPDDDDDDDSDVYLEGEDAKEGKQTNQTPRAPTPPPQVIDTKGLDARLAEIEDMERRLAEDRAAMEKEKEAIAFERESLEMQLNEEIQKNEGLQKLVDQKRVLGGQVSCVKEQQQEESPSETTSSTILDENTTDAKIRVLSCENDALKVQLQAEKREADARNKQLEEEIDKLKTKVESMVVSTVTPNEEDTASIGLGSRMSMGQLHGELLQARARIADKESTIDRFKTLTDELKGSYDDLQKELDEYREGLGTSKLEQEIDSLKKKEIERETAIEKERSETTMKLSHKDETIEFLIDDLANLKKEQSAKGSAGGCRSSFLNFGL